MKAPSRRLVIWWSAVALIMGTLVIANQVRSLGSAWGLVTIGTESPARASPGVPEEALLPGIGHDGQWAYVIATDPLARASEGMFDSARYRYRRVFHPLLGGVGGLLEGEALVWSLVLWNLASFVVATGALAWLSSTLRAGWLVPAAVAFNPGLWQALRVTAPDLVALALALTGIALWHRGSIRAAVAALALAALAKDQYLLVAAVLAMVDLYEGRRGRGILIGIGSAFPLLAWTAITAPLSGNWSNAGVSAPLVGIVRGAAYWPELLPWENALTAFLIMGFAVAVLGAVRTELRWLRWSALSWVLLGLVLSEFVWAFGNNSARVLAPVWVLGALAYGESRSPRTAPVA